MTDFPGPQASRIHDVFGLDRSVLCHHVPAASGGRSECEHARVAVDLGTGQTCAFCECVRRSGGVEVALEWIVNRAKHASGIDYRAEFGNFCRPNELRIEAKYPVACPIRAKKVPPVARGGNIESAGKMQAHILTR